MSIQVKVLGAGDNPMSEIKSVYQRCSWGWGGDERVQKVMQRSVAKVIAYKDEVAVGFCRAIGDGVYALIVDTMVVPEMKRQGVGRVMMESLLNHLSNEKFVVVKLMSSDEGKEFYESFGFQARGVQEPGMMLML